jgi:hypothetical protein
MFPYSVESDHLPATIHLPPINRCSKPYLRALLRSLGDKQSQFSNRQPGDDRPEKIILYERARALVTAHNDNPQGAIPASIAAQYPLPSAPTYDELIESDEHAATPPPYSVYDTLHTTNIQPEECLRRHQSQVHLPPPGYTWSKTVGSWPPPSYEESMGGSVPQQPSRWTRRSLIYFGTVLATLLVIWILWSGVGQVVWIDGQAWFILQGIPVHIPINMAFLLDMIGTLFF